MSGKVLLSFFLGVIITIFTTFSINKIRMFTVKKVNEKDRKSIILFLSEINERLYKNGGIKLEMPNVEKHELSNSFAKTTVGVYNPNSTCILEFEVASGFNENQNGKPYMAKISAKDLSSEDAKINCTKFAIKNILPLLLRGAFASIIEEKIIEEGTILKTFKPEDIMTAKNITNLVFDGGFVIDGLNIGIISTPNRTDIYITDCNNMKCHD